MSYYNQNGADMMPETRHGSSNRGNGGRGRGYQTFENPFGHQRGHGGYRGGNRGYRQQNYSNRGNRGGYQGKWQRGQGRGKNDAGRGWTAQPDAEFCATKYVLPEMTKNPWEELERKYEAENAGNSA